MEGISRYLLTFLYFIFLLHCSQSEKRDESFDVIPGGDEHTKETELNGVRCSFKYICQGGTKEQWQVMLESADDNSDQMRCVIERAGSTYLYFSHFELAVEGANIHQAELRNSLGDLIQSHEYDIKENKVKHKKDFKNSLKSLTVYISKGKQEL